MTHPQLNDDSSCFNCAAYFADIEGKPGMGGECHRHAPRPANLEVRHWPARAQPSDSEPPCSETSGAVVWPRIEDVFFCCDWLPAFKSDAGA